MVCGFALVSAAALGFKALQAEAAPSQLVLVVNTVEAGTSDAAKGDGVCATDQGLCSLRAAIEESNATKGDTEVSIEVAPGVNGSILMTTSDSTWMTKDNPTGKDSGAYFHVTRTVSIDLDNRLGVKASSNGDAAAFWIEAPNTKLLRFSNIFPGETAIVFGPDADGSTLDGGQTIQTENWNTERLVWIRGGADNITVKNYTVGHLYHDDSYSGAIVMRSPTLSQEIPIVGTTISNVTVDNTSTGNSCGTSSAAGCASLGLVISNTTVQGLTVENSRFTYAAGITIDDISAVNNFTVANSEFSESSGISIKDVPAVSGLAVNGSKFSNSSELSIDDCHVTDWQVENSSFASSSPVSIKDGVISNWVVGNSNFANASGISIDGDSVTDWQVENSSFANASGISSSGADVTRLTVTQSRFSDSSPLHLLASGLTTRVQLHSIKVDNSDFESSSGIRLRRAFFTGLEVLDSRFSYFTSGAEVIDVADGIGANPQLDIRGNTFKNIGSGTAAGDAVIRLPEGQTMGAASHISGNVFDNSDSALTQGYAINYDAGISSNNSTTASNLFIEDNYFDGYTKVGVKLEGTGTATVRRNTFGVNHANAYQNTSKPTTENEETADSNKASMFQNHDKTANRKILTWYPKRAEVVNGCQLAVDLLKPVSGNLPSEPVTIDFYYTAGTTAEEYLGSVDVESPEASGGKNVIVPNLPSRADGYIRVQTQGYSAAGQPESSQYSRTVALPKDDLSACAITGAAIELRAWRGVGADSTYDGIVNGGLAQEIPAGGPLAPGETVWFTYTVRNTGTVLLQQVVVKDQFADPVCIIASIKAGEEAGCSASRPVPA